MQFRALPGASVGKRCPSAVSWQAAASHVFVFLPTPTGLLLLHALTTLKTRNKHNKINVQDESPLQWK
jgi:hypothetical protein